MATPSVQMKEEFGALTTEFFSVLEEKNKKHDALLDEKIARMNEALSEAEKKMWRPEVHKDEKATKSEVAQKRADLLDRMLRDENDFISPEEKEFLHKSASTRESGFTVKIGREGIKSARGSKAMSSQDEVTGGALIFPEFVKDILKGIVLYSPIREMARVRQTATNQIVWPKRTGTFAASWTGENQVPAEAQGLTYGQINIPVHQMTAFADVTYTDLEDSAFDLASELSNEFTEQFAKAEGAAFVNGATQTRPLGFVPWLQGITGQVDVSGNANTFTYDSFNTMYHNFPTFYARNAMWGMNRKTIGIVRGLKDSQGRPIWMPFSDASLSVSSPPTIMDKPYQEIPDMPDVAANSYPVVLADWSKFYLIVDRIQLDIMKDPYSRSRDSVIRFLARKRVGGVPVLAEAGRIMEIHT